jgi:hypothetical protein
VTAALDRPVLTSVFTEWTLQPVGAVAVLVLAMVYTLGVRRLPAPGFLTRRGDLRQTLLFHPSLSSTDLATPPRGRSQATL